jgi:hypothetical protein
MNPVPRAGISVATNAGLPVFCGQIHSLTVSKISCGAMLGVIV